VLLSVTAALARHGGGGSFMSPLERLARLAAMVPSPRCHRPSQWTTKGDRQRWRLPLPALAILGPSRAGRRRQLAERSKKRDPLTFSQIELRRMRNETCRASHSERE